jgi:hypothetical protein
LDDGRRGGAATESTPLLATNPSTTVGSKQKTFTATSAVSSSGSTPKTALVAPVGANAAAEAEAAASTAAATDSQRISSATTEPGSIMATVPGNAAHQREQLAIETLRFEREEAIRNVQASIQDVNAIFKDIAVMVGDQAVQVEYVEVQMGDANDAIRAARHQLNVAQRRREAKKAVFFRALFFIALIVAIILIVLLS